jgi:hypothetical protein
VDAAPAESPDAGGDGGDTWASWAQGFFSTYCTSCHGASDPSRDFRTIADVVRDQAIIRCGVAATVQPGCGSSPAPKKFPIGTGPKPTDAERERVVAWIAAGLPQ